jgi:hypothetical protein
VVISSLGELSPAVIDKLETYVRDGGGLWLMLGTRLDRDDFNKHWYRDGAGLSPAPLSTLMRTTERDSAESSIHPPKGDHPATAMLADTDRLDIGRVRFLRYHTFVRQPGQELTPLLESGRGAPLAMLHHLGKGRVIIQAYPLRTDWSDMPISKSFVVLVQDWLTYLTQPASTRFNLASNEAFIYPLATDAKDETAEVTGPNGVKARVSPVDRSGARVYRFSQTNLPGRYELRRPSEPAGQKTPFRVASDDGESDLTRLSSEDMAMLSEAAAIQFGGTPIESTEVVQAGAGHLEPAWWPLLIMMVCLMAVESLLATRVSRGRFGAAKR